jgi:hypothetical protein
MLPDELFDQTVYVLFLSAETWYERDGAGYLRHQHNSSTRGPLDGIADWRGVAPRILQVHDSADTWVGRRLG